MNTVSATEFRQHLFEYLEQVQQGGPMNIQIRGRVVARLEPVTDPVQAARDRLAALAGSIVLGDVISPLDEPWGSDADPV